MTAFVLIVGAIGCVGAYILGLHCYGIHVKQQQLKQLARLFRDDRANFDLYFYNIAIDITKQEIALQND
jgi:hypothetical protein